MGNNKKDLNKEINAITIKIKRGTWELFKNIIPRNKTLNQAVVELIYREIDKNSRPATNEEIKEFFNKKKGRPPYKYTINKRK